MLLTVKKIANAFLLTAVDGIFFIGAAFDEINRVVLRANIRIITQGIVSDEDLAAAQEKYLITRLDAGFLR
jgi:hypothetical protein